MTTFTESPTEKIFRSTRDEKAIKNARRLQGKLKGRFINVPGVSPATQIFLRDGQDPQEAIEKFHSKREAYLTDETYKRKDD